MFTRAKIYGGERYLKNHLAANDYYAEGERVVGLWIGKGAGALGIAGEVSPEEFEALRENRHPVTGKRLTPRTKDTREPTMREAKEAFRKQHGRTGSDQEVANFRLAMKPLPNRVAFYDFQCSAQKSVSLMAVLAGDDRLRKAHEQAAAIAFAELERFAYRQKNTRTQRAWETTGNLCAAAFTHDASRALDPQLHTHFVIANATCDAAGRWYALEECQMYRAVRYAGKVYQNALAREVKRLGYNIAEVRDHKGQVTGFEIAGVSPELCRRFAKRRAEIEREIAAFEAKHGREPTSTEVAQISRQTREVKLAEASTLEVRSRQRAQLSPSEWKCLQVLHLEAQQRATQPLLTDPAGEERQALQFAVAHLFERRSVAPAHEVLAEALNQGLGSVDLAQLKQAIHGGETSLVQLAAPEGNPLLVECCTRYGLELERWSVAFVDATKERCQSLNAGFAPGGQLSVEQQEAVRAILSTRDQVFSFRGVAGAGKTTTLREVHRGLAEAGHRALYIAPTAAAAKVLQQEGFARATTVEDFLQNVSRCESLRGAVVICDEAGLKSNRQGAALLRLAHERGLRVLLVGDVRQHVSVEAGDFLRVLEAHSQLGRCEVSEIRRQQSAPGYKAAVEKMAAGDARGGLVALDTMGWLQESQADYLQRAAEDYLRLTQDGMDLERCLAVAPTWAENHRLTESIRSALQSRRLLASSGTEFLVHDSLQWTAQQKRNVRNYRDGQVVVFTRATGTWEAGQCAEVRSVDPAGRVTLSAVGGAVCMLPLRSAESFDVGLPRRVEVAVGDKLLVRANDKHLGLVNGQVLTVDRIDANGTIVTNEGQRIPSTFRQWSHGYVVTAHKAQGRTCVHVVVAAERLDAKAAYVACSRGRSSCVVHTPDKERLLARLPEGSRRAALDSLTQAHATLQVPASPSLVARLQAWLQLPAVVMQRVRASGASLKQRLEQTRQTVRRWEERRALVSQRRQVAPRRAQSTSRVQAP